jgi:hypothetical protein
MNAEDELQDRLSRLEHGDSFENCTADLDAAEAELLKIATALQTLTYPAQSTRSIAAQRAALLAAALARRGAPVLHVRAPLVIRGRWDMLPAWLKPARVAAFIAAVVVVIMGLLLLRPDVPTAVNTPLSSTAGRYSQFVPIISSARTVAAANPSSAVVAGARGVVELQTPGGQWKPLEVGQALAAGQHVRTQNLSSAALLFFDGSRTQLGPLTEVVLEKLDAPTSGPRTILLAQLSGSTDHQVAHSSDPASRYEVHTPNGTALAKGTVFQVLVTPALITRVGVEQGLVIVVNVNVTVQLTPGQVTTISPGTAPTSPAFHVTGEGIVTQMGAVWRIGGLDFHTTNTTVVVGNPQLGDRVAVDGHLAPDGAPDGERIADVITLISRASQNRFEFSGPVQAIGSDHWTIAGRTVAVSSTTQIDAGIVVSDLVKAEGVIQSDGTWLADSIRLLTDSGLPFEFTGVVQHMGATSWTISGITIAVTTTTEIEAGLQVGSLVKAEGHILPDGTWLADEIKLAPEFENRFEFSGIVQNMSPWVVSGITFSTTQQTEIDPGIAIGDRVKVEGRILPDGTWQADEISLLADQPLTFEFIGEVTHIDPWIVSGITFTVNSSTTIESGIVVGDRVRVTGIVQPDGTLLAHRIELLDEEQGCVEIRVKIVAIDGNQLVLSDGQTITLGDDVEIEGHLQISAVIIIRVCVQADGTLVVVSITVIFAPPPTVTPPPPPGPPPSGGGKVTICHYPGGNKSKGHTLSVGQAAVSAHLAHGDKLGACSGEDDDDDDDHD